MKKTLTLIVLFMLILGVGNVWANDNVIEVVWWQNLDPGTEEFENHILDLFHESHPNIRIISEYVGNWNEINEKLVLANASNDGTLPGVAICNTKFIAAYGNSGLFEDLTPYVEKTGYDISTIPVGVYDIGNVDGRQIAMPFLNNTQVIYYNKTVADQLGVTIPKDFNDWDEFFHMIKEKTGMLPLAMQSLDFYYGTIYRNAGVNVIKDGYCDLNTDSAIMITEQFQNWVNEGLVSWLSGSDASANMRQGFYDGNTFMVFHNSSALENYLDKCDFEVGIAWYPGFDGVYNADMGGGVVGIPSKNTQEVKDAAWEFIAFLEGPELSSFWVTDAFCLPTRTSSIGSPEIDEFLNMYPQYNVLFDNLENITPPFIHEGATQICKTWQNYMNNIMLNNADVVETSVEMATEIQEIMDEY